MAIWIDDTLTEQDRWLDMSPTARACLIELWAYCKRARNNGVLPTRRLKHASEAFTLKALEELVDQGWVHRDGTGCGTDTCPRGITGVAVMHDYLQHQESAQEMADRIDSRRDLSKRGNHKRWHSDRGVTDPDCKFCLEKASA